MDPLQLINDLEGLRDKIPAIVREEYETLLKNIRAIYEASIKFITPPQPVRDGKQNLTGHHTTLDDVCKQLEKSLTSFKSVYVGQGSDAYHTTANTSLDYLKTIRDHVATVALQHDTMATNFDTATGAKIALGVLLGGLVVTLGVLVFSGGTTAPVTVPAAAIEAGGGVVTVGVLTEAEAAAAAALFGLGLADIPEALLLVTLADLITHFPAIPVHPDWTLPDGRALDEKQRGIAKGLFNDPAIVKAFADPAVRMLVITWLLLTFGSCTVDQLRNVLSGGSYIPGLPKILEQAANSSSNRKRQLGAIRVVQTILDLPFNPKFVSQYGVVTPLNVVGVSMQRNRPDGKTEGDIDIMIKANGNLLYGEIGGSNKGSEKEMSIFQEELVKLKEYAGGDNAKAVCFLVQPNPNDESGQGIKSTADFKNAVSIAENKLGPENVFIISYNESARCFPTLKK